MPVLDWNRIFEVSKPRMGPIASPLCLTESARHMYEDVGLHVTVPPSHFQLR